MNKNDILEMVSSHYGFFRFATGIFNRIHPKNRLHAKKKYTLSAGVSLFKGLKIINSGIGNEVIIGDFAQIHNSTIVFYGNNNKVTLGDFVFMNDIELYMEDSNNEINIGTHSNLCGKAHLAAIEGTKINIGKDCLFSAEIHFRTGDSHSILNMDGKRINPSEDINIGNHVWIGTKVTCLKGVCVADNSIVAATTTLCSDYSQENVVIGGVPGKIIKTGVNWDNERIKI